MKNVVKLEHYHFPWQLEAAIRDFVAYYNNERYHESLENVTPADVYHGESWTHRRSTTSRCWKRRRGALQYLWNAYDAE